MNLTDPTLIEALATLPMRERRALELQSQGRSLADIAAALRVSRSTAARLVSSARQKLNARLKAAARADKWRNVLAGGTALDTSRADDGAKPGELDEGERNQ
jgi:DNA-binding CsgD family transcriptional regulator